MFCVFLLNVRHSKGYKLKFNKNVTAQQTVFAADPFCGFYLSFVQLNLYFVRRGPDFSGGKVIMLSKLVWNRKFKLFIKCLSNVYNLGDASLPRSQFELDYIITYIRQNQIPFASNVGTVPAIHILNLIPSETNLHINKL